MGIGCPTTMGIQLHGPLNFFLLAGGDIFPYRLRDALDGFGTYLQTGE